MPWPHDGWWWRIIQHIDTSVMRLLPLTGTKVNSLFVWNGNALASFAWLAVLLSISTMCIPAAHRATSFSPSSHTDAHVSCSPKQTKFRLMNMYIFFFVCVCCVPLHLPSLLRCMVSRRSWILLEAMHNNGETHEANDESTNERGNGEKGSRTDWTMCFGWGNSDDKVGPFSGLISKTGSALYWYSGSARAPNDSKCVYGIFGMPRCNVGFSFLVHSPPMYRWKPEWDFRKNSETFSLHWRFSLVLGNFFQPFPTFNATCNMQTHKMYTWWIFHVHATCTFWGFSTRPSPPAPESIVSALANIQHSWTFPTYIRRTHGKYFFFFFAYDFFLTIH